MLNIFLIKTTEYKDELINTLTFDQIQKARKYKQEEDFKRSVLSSYLLNNVLSYHNIVNPTIIYNSFGKPSLENNELYFNISHSGDYVVCATSSFEVGIDIERIRKMNELVISKCFSVDEQKYINSDEDFTMVWTLKESYLKMLGLGINSKLNSFSVIKENNIHKINDYNLVSLKIEDYHLSVCYKEKEKIKLNYISL